MALLIERRRQKWEEREQRAKKIIIKNEKKYETRKEIVGIKGNAYQEIKDNFQQNRIGEKKKIIIIIRNRKKIFLLKRLKNKKFKLPVMNGWDLINAQLVPFSTKKRKSHHIAFIIHNHT